MPRQSKRIKASLGSEDPNKLKLDDFLKIMCSALANDGIARAHRHKGPSKDENVSARACVYVCTCCASVAHTAQ